MDHERTDMGRDVGEVGAHGHPHAGNGDQGDGLLCVTIGQQTG
jgi:hypothetical protein